MLEAFENPTVFRLQQGQTQALGNYHYTTICKEVLLLNIM
jgi:hypothetical protein